MHIKQMIEFKNWADDVYLDIVSSLTEEQQNFTVAGYDRSIKQILFHMYEVYWSWYHLATDKDYSNAACEDMTFAELITSIQEINEQIARLADDEAQTREHKLKWHESHKEVVTNDENILFNFVTHSAYHRGQIALLLRAQGIVTELQETDFNPYIYELGQQ